jgi:hypothetical protein
MTGHLPPSKPSSPPPIFRHFSFSAKALFTEHTLLPSNSSGVDLRFIPCLGTYEVHPIRIATSQHTPTQIEAPTRLSRQSYIMELPLFEYQALSGPNQIRLVTILSNERGAAMKLELEHTDMDSDLKYECLSYAWGADDRDQSITLNSSSFLVSSTLAIALEHLHHASQKRKIWIDAISINQADIAERGSQVAIMRKIYQDATRVNVWLGPATQSSEQAMAFLKMMATAKKNSDRNTWIGGQGRVASDTSSELGPGEERYHWLSPQGSNSTSMNGEEEANIRTEEADIQTEEADIRTEDANMKPCDEAIPEDHNSIFSHVSSLNIESAERSRSLRSAEPLHDSADQVIGLTVRARLKNYFTKLYASLRRGCCLRRRGQRAYLDRWHEYDEALATEQATKNDFAVTGFPVLYNMDGNSRDEYFKNEWESHWQALDELLARPWWGRTWIVQEVWSASDAVLQCGATTIKWKTFQKAMDYSEAWDDMGDSVKGTKRELQWETLRRRYTLAIHLTKARVNGSTLSSLLWNIWDRASTDPRDKVFAMLPLVGGAENVSMVPDYGKSMVQVYREVAREIIVKQGQMDILLAASGVDGNDGLPSWVPDWRCEANAKKPVLLVNRHLMMKLFISGSMNMVVLNGHGYRAAGNSEAFALFSDDLSVLTVLGKKLDRIAEVCGADIAKSRDDDNFTDQSFDFVLRSKFVSTKTRRRESGKRGTITDLQDTSILFTTLTGGGKTQRGKQASTMRNTMRQRRLFVSQNGHIGIGPVDTQPGDVIFIISGCNFPIVLRPRDDKFAVVGEAYSECLD